MDFVLYCTFANFAPIDVFRGTSGCGSGDGAGRPFIRRRFNQRLLPSSRQSVLERDTEPQVHPGVSLQPPLLLNG